MSRSRAVMVSYGSPSFVIVGLFCHTSGCRLLQIVCSFLLFLMSCVVKSRMYVPVIGNTAICNIWLLNGLSICPF